MDRLASIAAAAARLDEPAADSNKCNDQGNKVTPNDVDVSNFALSMKEKDDSLSTSVVEVIPPSVPFSMKSWEESCDMQSSATQVQVKALVGISTAATGNSPPPKIPSRSEFGRTSELKLQETTRNVTAENPSLTTMTVPSQVVNSDPVAAAAYSTTASGNVTNSSTTSNEHHNHSRVVSLADSESSCESPPAKRIATPKTKRSSASASSSSTLSGDVPPGEAVDLINEHDVLCGRGGETNHHPGNVRYRTLVKQHQRDYLAAKRRDKPRIARLIVQEVRTAGGRFLKKDSAGTWRDVGSGKAREKTSQALREGAPELRNSDTPTTDSSPPANTIIGQGQTTIPHSNDNDEIVKSPSRVSSSSCSDNEFSYFSSDEVAQHQQDSSPQKMMIMGGHKRKRDSGLIIPQAADFTDTAASLLQLSVPSSSSPAAATISANDDEYSKCSSALQSYPPHFKEASTRGPRLKLLKARLTSA
eukprot:scaffold17576_cov46-Attheya_sp.AAC.2